MRSILLHRTISCTAKALIVGTSIQMSQQREKGEGLILTILDADHDHVDNDPSAPRTSGTGSSGDSGP